jgi:hypothetical protein
MLATKIRRLTVNRAVRSCPVCASWPDEIAIKIVEIIIEPGQPLPPRDPDEQPPGQFGPCAGCGRRHKAKVVEIVNEEAEDDKSE